MSKERQWQSAKAESVNHKWETVGQEIEGYLVDVKEEQGQQKNSTVFTLKTDSNEKISFWGSKVLDDQMSKVEIGVYVKIKYLGKTKPTKSSMQPYHNFEVFFDDSDILDLSEVDSSDAEPVAAPAYKEPKAEAPKPSAVRQARPAVAEPVASDPFADADDDLPFN